METLCIPSRPAPYKRFSVSEGELRAGILGSCDRAFEDRRGMAGCLQLLQVEGHGKQRAFVHKSDEDTE